MLFIFILILFIVFLPPVIQCQAPGEFWRTVLEDLGLKAPKSKHPNREWKY
jgi:hypothetical protein